MAGNDPTKIIEMVNDEEFPAHRLAELLRETLVFVFLNTDPEQELICESMQAITILNARFKMPKRKIAGGGNITPNQKGKSTTPVERNFAAEAERVGFQTSNMFSILRSLTRHEIMKGPNFQRRILKIKKLDVENEHKESVQALNMALQSLSPQQQQ